VTKDKGKTVESEVEVITETENARDIEGREDEQPQVRVLTETEIGILASMGDAIPGFEDSQEAQADNILQDEPEQVQDRIEETAQVTATSDTTESTPEILKSPDKNQDRVPGSSDNATSSVEKTVVAKTVAPRKYKGWVIIPETEEKEGSSDDSEDNVPVASLLQGQSVTSTRLRELQDFKEGPIGKRAIGKTVAKIFDRVEFRGKVDKFRQVRQRYYYHITYDDGDEEEMTQIELRDAYLLANTDKIQTEWDELQLQQQREKDVESEQSSKGETDSGSEGSEYDRHDFEKDMKQTKRKSKTTFKQGGKRQKCYKRGSKKPSNDMSGVVLPQSGDKSVAGEAYAKLDVAQKQLVSEKVNKQTKQVQHCTHLSLQDYFINILHHNRSLNNQFGITFSTLGITMP
jgi:hypothetical protein